MFGLASLAFQRRHRLLTLETLPKPRTEQGLERGFPMRARCRCGWVGPTRESRTTAAGDGLDHVEQEWLRATNQ